MTSDPTDLTLQKWLDTLSAGAQDFFAEAGAQAETFPLLHVCGFLAATPGEIVQFVTGIAMAATHDARIRQMQAIRTFFQQEHQLVILRAALITEGWMVERPAGEELRLSGPVSAQPDRIEIFTISAGDIWGQQAGHIWRIVTAANGRRRLAPYPQEWAQTENSLLTALLQPTPFDLAALLHTRAALRIKAPKLALN